MSEEDKKKARAKMADIQKRLKNGEDFAKVAMAQSEDTSSGGRGGDRGGMFDARVRVEAVPMADKQPRQHAGVTLEGP